MELSRLPIQSKFTIDSHCGSRCQDTEAGRGAVARINSPYPAPLLFTNSTIPRLVLVHGVGATLDDPSVEGNESLAGGRIFRQQHDYAINFGEWIGRVFAYLCAGNLCRQLNRARGNGYKDVRRYLTEFPLMKSAFLSIGTVNAILLIGISATTSSLIKE
jgi:hypothetical protein